MNVILDVAAVPMNVIVDVAFVPMNVIVCVAVAMTAVLDDIWNETRYHWVPSFATLTMRLVAVLLGAGRLTSLFRTLTVFGVLSIP
jgi:hypothetical protein